MGRTKAAALVAGLCCSVAVGCGGGDGEGPSAALDECEVAADLLAIFPEWDVSPANARRFDVLLQTMADVASDQEAAAAARSVRNRLTAPLIERAGDDGSFEDFEAAFAELFADEDDLGAAFGPMEAVADHAFVQCGVPNPVVE